jgi:formylglycine-generating enzyme required for sulfatase activity
MIRASSASLPMIFLLCSVGLSVSFAQEKKGYIQVECEAGVKMFLDDEFKGTTNADEGGLIIQDIPAGSHKLKAVKEGFSPQEKSYKVDQFVPKIRIEEKGDEGAGTVSAKTGVLVIKSLPIDCTVHCPALGLDTYAKTKDMLQLSDVPEGAYDLSFRWKDKQLWRRVQVKGGFTLKLMANFIKGAVEETVEKTVEKPVEKPSENVPEDSTASSAEFKSPAFEKVGKNTQGYMEYKHKQTGMVFVLLPGGTFKMGTDNGNACEKPVHEVNVDGFLISKYEMTQGVWKKIMVNNPSNFKDDGNPVEQVSWDDCREFCRKAGLRLPTEAEWEYACRAGTTTEYYWGDEPNSDYMWYDGNSEKKVHPVGQKKPNGFGLYDMSGNVYEWCADRGDGDYYKNSPHDNPTGSVNGKDRVIRGGSAGGNSSDCRSSYRGADPPSYLLNSLGFRCVQDSTK